LYQPQMIDYGDCKNPTWQDPGPNPGRRGGKPATNCMSYGAALSFGYSWY
jgi:hypothetical protein